MRMNTWTSTSSGCNIRTRSHARTWTLSLPHITSCVLMRRRGGGERDIWPGDVGFVSRQVVEARGISCAGVSCHLQVLGRAVRETRALCVLHAVRWSTLENIGVCCRALQCVAVQCRTLQYIATRCSTMLQYAAASYNALQRVVACCSVLQRSVLQYVAMIEMRGSCQYAHSQMNLRLVWCIHVNVCLN